jgi:hypothetical protein
MISLYLLGIEVHKKNYTPYEQVEVTPHVTSIKELDDEEVGAVYLCQNSNEIFKGKNNKIVVGHLFMYLLGLLVILDLVIWGILVSFHILHIWKSKLIFIQYRWRIHV